MRALLQRVRYGSVSIDDKMVGEIQHGLVILLGVSPSDTEKDVDFLVDKTAKLRIFEDCENKMNLSLLDVKGEALVISQFTLYADCRKGRRPSFTDAASPDIAVPLYEKFIARMKEMNIKTCSGVFGADMQVVIHNDGPVTILLTTDS